MTDDWELVYDDGMVAKYEKELDENNVLLRTVFYAAPSFYGANEALRNESEGKRFGDGQVVASIPPTVWANELAQPIKEGDMGWFKRWLNNPDHRAYRTFRGTV